METGGGDRRWGQEKETGGGDRRRSHLALTVQYNIKKGLVRLCLRTKVKGMKLTFDLYRHTMARMFLHSHTDRLHTYIHTKFKKVKV